MSLQCCFKDLFSCSVHHCWSSARLPSPPRQHTGNTAGTVPRWGAAPYQLPFTGQAELAAQEGAGRDVLRPWGWRLGRQSSKYCWVAVPPPASAELPLGLPPTAGLEHVGGTQASSKPVAKSSEKSEGLKSSTAPLSPFSPIRRIQGFQTCPWGTWFQGCELKR